MAERLNNNFQFLDVGREDPEKVRVSRRKKDFAEIYKTAIGGTGKYAMRQSKALNQQLGRLIRTASGAKGKRTEDGAVARAQVKGEIIRTYTLLVRD